MLKVGMPASRARQKHSPARGNVPMIAACLIALTSSAGVTTRSGSPAMIRRYSGSASAGDATAKASARSNTPAREDCSPAGAAASAAGAGAEAATDPPAGVPSIAAGDMAGVSDPTKAATDRQYQSPRQGRKRRAQERGKMKCSSKGCSCSASRAAIQLGVTDSAASKPSILRTWNRNGNTS